MISAKLFIRYAILTSEFSDKIQVLCAAEEILNSLLNKSYAEEYLEIRSWLFRILGELYENEKNNSQAILYWEKAVEDSEKLYVDRGIQSDERDYIQSLNGLWRLVVKDNEWERIVEVTNRLLVLEGEKVSYLYELSKAYGSLGLRMKKNEIDAKISTLEDRNKKYADAYQEIIEILKYTDRAAVNKIPKQRIIMWKKLANKNHGFKVNLALPFEEQVIMEETRAICANIFHDYWATDKLLLIS